MEEEDEYSRTGLLLVCARAWPDQSKAVEMIDLLARHKANMNHKDENGWNALHHACHTQNFPAIEALLKHGTTATRDNIGFFPQVRALEKGETMHSFYIEIGLVILQTPYG